jgi:hypothetical protein
MTIPAGLEFLQNPSGQKAEFARLEELQRLVQSEITTFSGQDRLDREQVHDRAAR